MCSQVGLDRKNTIKARLLKHCKLAVAAKNAVLAGDSDRKLHVRSDTGRVAAAEPAELITHVQEPVLARKRAAWLVSR